MKKENRKMAQERRAKERRKKELRRKISKIIVIAIPLIAVIALIIAIIVTSGSADSSTSSGDAAAESSSGTDDSTEDSTEDTDAEDTSGTDDSADSTAYSTDSSLTVEDGDTVNIDYVGSVDGVEFDGGNTQGMGTDLVIGSGSYIDDFEEQLIGAHPGDEVDVYVTFPDPYQNNTDLSGKEALFEVTINGPIEVPNTENSVTVSNLNIEAIDENSAPILTGDFICHMRPTESGTEIGDISVSDAGSSEESRGYISIPLYIRQGTAETSGDVGNVSEYEKKAIALGPNDKIRVRGFFLRGDNNNEGGNIPVETLQLRVATIGGEANVKKLETGAILNHKVNIVNLPAVKKEGTNYWISSLDPNIYISELSMPGSKFSYLTSENHPNTTVYQGVDIDTQFQDGVRAFIVQTNATVRYTADYHSGGLLGSYDNIHVTSEGEDLLLAGFSNSSGLTLENTLESISAALDKPINELGNNCQEYAVVLLTYDGVVASFDKPNDAPEWGAPSTPELPGNEAQNAWMRVLAKKLKSLKNSDQYKIYTDPITADT